jgi:hypothetical protein
MRLKAPEKLERNGDITSQEARLSSLEKSRSKLLKIAQILEEDEMEQSEEELYEISSEIQVGKARGQQKIAKSLKALKDHEMVPEANEEAYKWKGKVRRL